MEASEVSFKRKEKTYLPDFPTNISAQCPAPLRPAGMGRLRDVRARSGQGRPAGDSHDRHRGIRE